MAQAAARMREAGRLPDNILYFARTLRGAGMRVGPASVVDAVRAVSVAGITDRDDFYWILHSVFVNRHEDHAVFDEAFRLFWRSRELVEKMLQMFSPIAMDRQREEEKRAGQARVSQSLFSGQENQREVEKPQVEIDAMLTASGREVLRKKDFAQMTAEELAQARLAMAKLVLPVQPVRTRRYKAVNRPARIDARRTLSNSMKSGGDLVLPRFRKQRLVHPPIVVLADISGSMANYSRTFLHFIHALAESRQRVHTFLFGTRLTNVTRQLRNKDIDEALANCTDAVEDWSGGTRIGATLHEFNRKWSRRVLGQGAIVLLITDGLERDDDELLEHEIDRLHRSCRRLIWLNPLLRFDGFQARARGIRTMLPHVDEFRAVHSLDALADLCHALSAPMSVQHDPRRWLQAVQAA
ncbi:MAG: VWA domain-containing protein [Phyllobacteriaceae bacterium]|nr:VWA domain-containing protein [Phyllobacteriaceae bacterium]